MTTKVLIVYDSASGNTKKIAQEIATSVGNDPQYEVKLHHISEVNSADLKDCSFLIIGSPTQGGRATQAVQNLLVNIPNGALSGMRVAAFDTRFAAADHGLGLRLLMKIIRFAAPRIASVLQEKGGTLAAEPAGFIVKDREGPLKEGELARARLWAQEIIKPN